MKLLYMASIKLRAQPLQVTTVHACTAHSTNETYIYVNKNQLLMLNKLIDFLTCYSDCEHALLSSQESGVGTQYIDDVTLY